MDRTLKQIFDDLPIRNLEEDLKKENWQIHPKDVEEAFKGLKKKNLTRTQEVAR